MRDIREFLKSNYASEWRWKHTMRARIAETWDDPFSAAIVVRVIVSRAGVEYFHDARMAYRELVSPGSLFELLGQAYDDAFDRVTLGQASKLERPGQRDARVSAGPYR
jgi:hypothetical protein